MLSDQALTTLLKVIGAATGMDFSGGRSAIVARRIEERMRALQCESWQDYQNIIATDAGERTRLVEAITINETFFFRHPEQFTALRSFVLFDVAQSPTRRDACGNAPIRIWSAGCASGCEPYSIAIAANESVAWANSSSGPSFEIIATDIDGAVLGEAREGRYFERAVTQEMSADYQRRYFVMLDERRWSLVDSVRKNVRFHQLNLVTDIYPAECDVVFCRNVLYYFSVSMRVAILRRLWRSLRPGGYLFLGPTETLGGLEAFFRPADCGGAIYQSWTTDRRVSEKLPLPPEIAARRKAPVGHVTSDDGHLQLVGVIATPDDLNTLRQSLALEVGASLMRGNGKGQPITLDCLNLIWISNDALYELFTIIDVVNKKGGFRICNAVFSAATVRDWFVQAGYRALFSRMEVDPGFSFSAAQGRAPMLQNQAAPSPVQRHHPVMIRNAPVATSPPQTPRGMSSSTRSRPPVHSPSKEPSCMPPHHQKEVRIVIPELGDRSALPLFREAMTRSLEETRLGGKIVIALEKCRYMDDSMVRELARAIQSCADRCEFILANAAPSVRRVLDHGLRHLRMVHKTVHRPSADASSDGRR